MQGYSGAPARQYLICCEEAMETANAVVSSSAGSLPAIARPALRHLIVRMELTLRIYVYKMSLFLTNN